MSTSGLDELATERAVAVAGDWHGDVRWVQRAVPAFARQHPDVRTVLHVGDLGVSGRERPPGFLGTVDYWLGRSGIDRLLLTPGNHDDWAWLDAEFASSPGRAVLMSERVWALPRGLRFEIGGRSFLSFGGAASMDYASRTPGKSWWAQEAPTALEAEYAAAGGPVDVLLTHDMVNGGTRAADEQLSRGRWSPEAHEYSQVVRAAVTFVWESVRPRVLAHGHMHVMGERELQDGRRVYSLGCEWMRGNLGVLDLRDMDWEWVRLPELERDRHDE
ncbi:metallophosphoesterase [Agromyces mediolanus]|uniref:metallophosphoesterase family protein n=1 Tax=Agromyces mediolanus TaxID=41986 RepID=UPI003835BBC9